VVRAAAVKWLGVVLALEIFIELTQPGGGKIWIEESHITMIRTHLGNCTGKTVIVIGGTNPLCVMESPDEVRRKIDETKK
jgi:uncharacterized protein YlzI (FlbEa/FlbD family)